MVMQWHVLSSENSLISLLVCDLENGQPLTIHRPPRIASVASSKMQVVSRRNGYPLSVLHSPRPRVASSKMQVVSYKNKS
ncbi:hypothetical protein Q502_04865 [Mesotoga sp. Brook.08.YT.4.2.5.2.]|nr:hypothetical protein Q502_04865 [Mesotoga sp. Brook.08.YT.4.2.5.2.]